MSDVYVRAGKVRAQIEPLRGPRGERGPAGESSERLAGIEKKLIELTGSVRLLMQRIEKLENALDEAGGA